MQHEALFGLAFKALDALLVVCSAKRGGHQCLGLAASEYRGAVGARQYANFNIDVADLIEGARIRPLALVRYLLAEDALAQGLVIARELGQRLFIIFRDRVFVFGLERLDLGVALGIGLLLGVLHVGHLLAYFRLELGVIR